MDRKYRYEEKYLLSPKKYHILVNRINKLFNLDQHTSNADYIVTTLYFDDFLKRSVQQKQEGYHDRYKFRLRYYDHNKKFIILEKKTKRNNSGYKEKLFITEQEYNSLVNHSYGFLKEKEESHLAKEFLYLNRTRLLKPLIEIEYRRQAFTLPINDIRITFDKDLSYKKNNHLHKLTDNIILEIKYNDFFPQHLKTLFRDLSLNKLSISKFLTCYLHMNGEEVFI